MIGGYFYFDTSESLFRSVIDKFSPIDWDKIHPRNIVKNSIPVELLESNGSSCVLKADTFEMILNHDYFIRNYAAIEKLQFNEHEKTIVLPCDEIHGDISRLNIWYVVEESPLHPTEWKYFVTAWDEIVP